MIYAPVVVIPGFDGDYFDAMEEAENAAAKYFSLCSHHVTEAIDNGELTIGVEFIEDKFHGTTARLLLIMCDDFDDSHDHEEISTGDNNPPATEEATPDETPITTEVLVVTTF